MLLDREWEELKMMKKIYLKPQIEETSMLTEDMIATSVKLPEETVDNVEAASRLDEWMNSMMILDL